MSQVLEVRLKIGEIVRRMAKIRPILRRASRIPDREALIMSIPETIDSGHMLEQDRTWGRIWPNATGTSLNWRRRLAASISVLAWRMKGPGQIGFWRAMLNWCFPAA